MSQMQKQKSTSSGTAESIQNLPQASEEAEKLKADLDELLDEIDEVLEENAEQFVKHYVQRGGE